MERRVGLRGGGQGWTDSQIITSLILLNLAGGEPVMDLEVLEKDAGLCRVLRHAETHGMRRRERRALKARWRGERWRRALRGAVIARKVSHCSKNAGGADAFSAFTSVIRTLARNGGDHSLVNGPAVCSAVLRSPPLPSEPLLALRSANQLRLQERILGQTPSIAR